MLQLGLYCSLEQGKTCPGLSFAVPMHPCPLAFSLSQGNPSPFLSLMSPKWHLLEDMPIPTA